MRDGIIQKLNKVMASLRFILGGNVKQPESDIARYSNVKHDIRVGNGSNVIHITL